MVGLGVHLVGCFVHYVYNIMNEVPRNEEERSGEKIEAF